MATATDVRFAGAALKAVRMAAGLTVRTLAPRAGVSYAEISYYETGRRAPRWSFVVAAARALKIEPGRLLSPPQRGLQRLSRTAVRLAIRQAAASQRSVESFAGLSQGTVRDFLAGSDPTIATIVGLNRWMDLHAGRTGRARASPPQRQPHPVDAHVGRRLRQRRTLLGLTQTALGTAAGVTFQQIQKYERGRDSVSAGRLYALAAALDVPVSYFFDGPAGGKPATNSIDTRRETLVLVRAYYGIRKRATRRQLVRMIEAIAAD